MTLVDAPSDRPSVHANVMLGICQILVWGGSLFFLAVFAEPVHRDTGWSLTWIYGALTIGVLISALLSPKAGRLIGCGHGRSLLIASGCAIALGMFILGIATHYLMFLFGWCVIGVGMAGGLYDPLFATLGRRYGRSARSAINMVTLIAGFATTVTWPLQAWMIDAWSWRPACMVYAMMVLACIVPFYLWALPPDGSRVPAGDAAETPATALGPKPIQPPLPGRIYWLLSMVFSIAAILMTAVSVQIIVLLKGTGHSDASAIAIGTLIGPSMVLVRVVSLGFRNVHPIWMAVFSAACVALGLMTISLSAMMAAIGIVCYGVGNGLRALVRGTLPLALVSPEALPVIMGKLSRSSLLCQALTPLGCGFLISHIGAGATLWLLTALALINAGLSLQLQRSIRRSVGRS